MSHQNNYSVLSFSQGDSGGPLTVVNEKGAHILVGIVSSKDACSKQDYAVFTNVSAFLQWIQSSIEKNGGMASCTSNISAPPTLGMQHTVRQLQNVKKKLEILN